MKYLFIIKFYYISFCKKHWLCTFLSFSFILFNYSQVKAQFNASMGNGTNNNGSYNSAFGANALFNNSTGSYNTAAGYNALFTNTSNSYNTAIGRAALYYNEVDNNTATGDSALFSNVGGLGNTATGAFALMQNTYGSYNTATGFSALSSNILGAQNTATGYTALKVSKAANNTATGYNALGLNTIGTYNTATGAEALENNDSGSNNTAIGWVALAYFGGSNSNNNTAVGAAANGGIFRTLNTANHNTSVGSFSMTDNHSGSYNTAVGDEVLQYNIYGSFNTGVGVFALDSNYKGSYNTAIGLSTLYDDTTGSYNTAIGMGGLLKLRNGQCNVSIGGSALYSNTNGSFNTALGHTAGTNNLNGSGNVFLGFDAGNTEIGSNKLYISDNSTSVPLIYGDFTAGKIGIANSGTLISSLNIASLKNGSKITFVDGGANINHCGFGVTASPNKVNYHVYNTDYAHVFLAGGKNGDGIELMRVQGNGNVGIGTSTPSNKLTVNGNMLIGDPSTSVIPSGYNLSVQKGILTEGLKLEVSKSNGWPDYVFENNYQLKSFEELESYIKTNKHLPNIPSAYEVNYNGVSLTSMYSKLLEKIEESYLYVIRLEEINAQLEKRITKLKTYKQAKEIKD